MKWMIAAALVLVACDKGGGTAPSATATTTAPAPTATSTVAAPPPPEALDVETLRKALKCGAKGAGPCEVLAGFSSCETFDPVTQSGDGRWLGEAHFVKKGAFVDDWLMMRSRRVAITEVGPGQLMAKIAIAKIDDTYPEEREHAGKAIRAFERGDVPAPTNQAIRFAKERDEWTEAYSMKAAGNQVYAAIQGGTYLCKISKQRVLLVALATDREHPADGTYATLWPVSW
jgi:hypothetical protein